MNLYARKNKYKRQLELKTSGWNKLSLKKIYNQTNT